MWEAIHRVAGGLVALSAAVLAAFATDLATRPTSWAVPIAGAVFLIAATTWLTTWPRISDWPARRADERSADKETFKDLIAMVPRSLITTLKEHDFGDSWSRGMVVPLYEYAETRDAVEHRFHDRKIEERRRRFHSSVSELTRQLGGYSFPTETGNGFFELGDKQWLRTHPPDDEHNPRFETQRRELNELADGVTNTYDELMGEVQRRLPNARNTL